MKQSCLDFGDLDPFFKVTQGLRLLENGLSDFGDLDPIFKVTWGSDCWKMACLHPISRMNVKILTKLVHLYCCDMEKLIRLW